MKREFSEVTEVLQEGEAWGLEVGFASRVPVGPTFSTATGYFLLR